MKVKVVILYGGKSAEHEVSCRSAAFLIKHLHPERYDVKAIAIDKSGNWLPQNIDKLKASKTKSLPIDESVKPLPLLHNNTLLDNGFEQSSPNKSQETVVFPMIHGTNGEDGTLQGLLEMANCAYVGADTLGSAIGMDKAIAKVLAQAAHINVVPFLEVRLDQWQKHVADICNQAIAKFGFPLFVKPARLGSSVGISKVHKESALRAACQHAFKFDDKIVIEQGLDAREIECAVLGDYDPDVSIPGEVVPHDEFYTYEAKYLKSDGAALIIPAELSKEQVKQAQTMSKQVFQALQLYGMARVDLFLEKQTGTFYFNEVNTIPGFTEISQFPLLWIESGLTEQQILDKLIELALKRQRTKDNFSHSR